MAQLDSFKKARSPRYPRISLDSAIGYVRRFYEEAHRSQVDPDTAARLMGFSGKNGASAIALGAIRQFGLVDGLRGSLKVSDLAMKILQPSSREEAYEARIDAAYKPEVFEKLAEHFEWQFPRSDEPIKAHLIRTMGFSQAGAEECIATLRETAESVETPFIASARAESISTSEAPTEIRQQVPTLDVRDVPHETRLGGEFVRIPLSKACTAELRFSGPVDGEAIDRLVQYIELMKGVWAE